MLEWCEHGFIKDACAACARKKMKERAESLGQWLKENAPSIADTQKHLDADTPERAYWHYGYRAALLDAIRLLEGT